MRTGYKFQAVCGAAYTGGPLLFSPGGGQVISPTGARLTKYDLSAHRTQTFSAQHTLPVVSACLSPDGTRVFSSDARGHALLIDTFAGRELAHLSLGERPYSMEWSPDGKHIAVGLYRTLEVWRVPVGEEVLEFAPFTRVAKVRAARDAVVSLCWGAGGKLLAVGSADGTAKVYEMWRKKGTARTLLRTAGSFSAHSDACIGTFFEDEAEGAKVLVVTKDGRVTQWTFTPAPTFHVKTESQFSSMEEEEGKSESTAANREKAEEINGDDAANELDDEDENELEESDLHGAVKRSGGSGSDSETDSEDEDEGNAIRRLDDDYSGDVSDEGAASDVYVRPIVSQRGKWHITGRTIIVKSAARTVKSAAYCSGAGLLAVGCNHGVFSLVRVSDMAVVQTLSASRRSVAAIALSRDGERVALGSRALGQVVVWAWRSETYVLKQQGHAAPPRCCCWSPDGRRVATGGGDGRVKVWDARSWFCFVTFAEHRGPVTAVSFSPDGLSLVSASLDGTVRAYDLVRYRNYRVLEPPPDAGPAQFSCLALDPAADLVAAGCQDRFEIFVWALQTGRCLDVLSGHEAPVSALSFPPASSVSSSTESGPRLASASWDKTVRLWDVYGGKGVREELTLEGDATALCWKPDGSELCVATLGGTLSFWDPETGQLLGEISGIGTDLQPGRLSGDARTAANSALSLGGASCVAYSPDGTCVLVGGASRNVLLYHVGRRLLVRRWSTTQNQALDGLFERLDSRNMTEIGPSALLPGNSDSDSDHDDRELALPGAQSSAQRRPRACTTGLAWSPDARAWCAAAPEGLLVYALDTAALFDPDGLEITATRPAARCALRDGKYLQAIVVAARIGDNAVLRDCIAATPLAELHTVVPQLPLSSIPKILVTLADILDNNNTNSSNSNNNNVISVKDQNGGNEVENRIEGEGKGSGGCDVALERVMLWSREVLRTRGEDIRVHDDVCGAALRALRRAVSRRAEDIAPRAQDNLFTLEYLVSRQQHRSKDSTDIDSMQ